MDKGETAIGPTSSQHKIIALENNLGENGGYNKIFVDFAGFLGVYDDGDIILFGYSENCINRENDQDKATIQAALILSELLSRTVKTRY